MFWGEALDCGRDEPSLLEGRDFETFSWFLNRKFTPKDSLEYSVTRYKTSTRKLHVILQETRDPVVQLAVAVEYTDCYTKEG